MLSDLGMSAAAKDPTPFSVRLRVTHLLLLTTTCAVIASVRMAWTDWTDIPVEIHAYALASIAFASIMYGVAISGLLLFAWQRWNTGAWSAVFPGHWLLLCMAVCVLLDAVCGIGIWLWEISSKSANVEFIAWNLNKIALCSSAGLNCVLFSRMLHGNRCWRLVLLVPGGVLLLLVPQHCWALLGVWRQWFDTSHAYAQVATTTVLLILILVASLHDHRDGLRYDWLHWTGVAAVWLFAGGGLVEAIGWLSYFT